MTKKGWMWGGVLMAAGILLGVGVDRIWRGTPARAAATTQETRTPRPPVASLPEEVARLKALVPSNSHIMMDVEFHWKNLWFAGQHRNWPLAQYLFNESRNHIRWLIQKSPTTRGPDGNDVDLKGIFDGIDTSSLAGVKAAIEQKDVAQFEAAYKLMLESCYACHKSAGRPYIRPMVPETSAASMINFEPNAAWPQ